MYVYLLDTLFVSCFPCFSFQAIAQGVKPPKKKLTKTQQKNRERDRLGKDAPGRGMSMNAGTFKNGTLYLSKEMIKMAKGKQPDNSSERPNKAKQAKKGRTKTRNRFAKHKKR